MSDTDRVRALEEERKLYKVAAAIQQELSQKQYDDMKAQRDALAEALQEVNDDLSRGIDLEKEGTLERLHEFITCSYESSLAALAAAQDTEEAL